MGKYSKTPGLTKIGETWHIDKQIRGSRLCESTGSSDLKEAEAYLAHRIEEIRQARIYGVRPQRTFRHAATKYLLDATESGELRSLDRNAQALKLLDPYIGDLPLAHVHMGTLEPYIRDRRKQGIRTGTIRRDLAPIRRVLNLASRLWRDEHVSATAYLIHGSTMPYSAPRPCAHPGCGELVKAGRCDKHKKQTQRRQDRDRGTAHQRGYTARWQKARASFLRQHPLCVHCESEGRVGIAGNARGGVYLATDPHRA